MATALLLEETPNNISSTLSLMDSKCSALQLHTKLEKDKQETCSFYVEAAYSQAHI